MTGPTANVLFVCTANQCRSPMAEALARAAFERAGLDWSVSSAGTLADEGIEATDAAAAAMSKLGLDLSAHRSRPVTDELVDAASLIVCMERNHVVDVCADRPEAFARTYTLKDLARRAATTHRHPAEPLEHWLARLDEHRSPHDVLGQSASDDVPDPTGHSFRRHRKTATELAELLDVVIEQLNPPVAV